MPPLDLGCVTLSVAQRRDIQHAEHEVRRDSYKVMELVLPSNPKVLDVGACCGAFTRMVAEIWPGAIIHAYEPDSRNWLILGRSVEGQHNITCYREALAGKSGRALFQVAMLPSCGSLEGRLTPHRGSTEVDEVLCTTLVTALMRLGGSADVLKLDCEGAEGEVLETHPDVLERIGYVCGEWHGHEQRKRVEAALAKTHDVDTTIDGIRGYFYGKLRR